ncbi:MAG: DUF2608 domain-containing protein [Candidatus Dependentiae bacterium]|nr:DUF2608 domain-containing protein [Candidatus Dependentiae bacterium]
MRILKMALNISLLACSGLAASITQTDSLSDVFPVLDRISTQGETLVIFDLDNTLIRAAQLEGTDEWFRAETGALMQAGKSESEAWELVLPIYTAAQLKTAAYLVDDAAMPLLDTLRVRGIRTIASTSRGRPDMCTATFRQLGELGISFEQKEPAWQTRFTLAPLPRETSYERGIIFGDGNNKGETLSIVFERLNYQPARIIFIDDSLGHVRAIEAFAQKRGIEFVGFHFTRVAHGLLDQRTGLPAETQAAQA